MDEDEARMVMQSQLDAEECFGSTSYASLQVPLPTNARGSTTMTAQAFQAAIMTDTDSSAEDDDADFGDDLVSPRNPISSSPSRHARAQSSTPTMMQSSGTIAGRSNSISSGGSFVPALRSRTASRSEGLVISSARANSLRGPVHLPDNDEPPTSPLASPSVPPPTLPPPSDNPPPSLPPAPVVLAPESTSTSLYDTSSDSGDVDDEPPPSLTVPDLPPEVQAFRPASKSLRVVGIPPPLTIPMSSAAMSNTGGIPSPISPTIRSSGGSLSSPRASSHMIGKLSLNSSAKDASRPRLYNPSQLPNGMLQGDFHLFSPQLPVNHWIAVKASLTSGQVRWQCTTPECYGMIELSTVSKVSRSTYGLESLAPGSVSFSVETTVPEQWYLAYTTAEMCALWKEAVETESPNVVVSSGGGNSAPGSGGSGESRKKLKKSSGPKPKAPVSDIALTTAKTRLYTLGGSVSTATFNLLKLFFHGKYTFVKAIFAVIQATEADKVAASLARMFFFADIPLQLIKSVIDWEVERTTIVNQLFRQDSIASKVMTAYTRLIAQPYLVSTLRASVQRISKCGKELEINPDTLSPEERDAVGSRVFLLQSIVTELLETIQKSIHLVPTECRLICMFLKQAVSGKFSDDKATEISLAGYLFLRMINPALVVPDSIGIIEKDNLSADGRRALLLVSKIVLNLANQVEFHKEPYLIPFNDFLTEKLPTVQKFINECADVPPEATMTATNLPPPIMLLEEMGVIYKLLHPIQEKLAAALAAQPQVQKRMKAAFAAIGAPAPPSPLPGNPTSDSKDLSKKDKKALAEKEELARRIGIPPHLWHFVSKSVLVNAEK